MTETARVIALPPDDASELDALRSAFRNCAIFYKLFEDMQKGTPLARHRLGNRAVHAFGVSPSSVGKFEASFVESAVAAGIAQVDDDGQVTLLDSDADFVGGRDGAQESTSPTSRSAQPSRSALPVVHQAWPIDGGTIVVEIRSDRPLPASAYATVGDVVASLERLSLTLAPVESDRVIDKPETTA